jgi:hypothetical protein
MQPPVAPDGILSLDICEARGQQQKSLAGRRVQRTLHASGLLLGARDIVLRPAGIAPPDTPF